jgi:hypothetical protein
MVKKNKNIIVFAVVIVFVILIASVFGTYPVFLRGESYSMDVTTGTVVGVNLAHDKIHFGEIQPGTFSKRDFQLSNSADYKVKARFGCEGDICSFIYYEKNNFVMDANSNATVHITVSLPTNVELNKTFEGNLTIKFYKQLF